MVVDSIFSVDVFSIVECVLSCAVGYAVDVIDTVESGVVISGTVKCVDVVCDTFACVVTTFDCVESGDISFVTVVCGAVE